MLDPRKGVSLGISWENTGGAPKPSWGIVVWNGFLKQIASMLDDRERGGKATPRIPWNILVLFSGRERIYGLIYMDHWIWGRKYGEMILDK